MPEGVVAGGPQSVQRLVAVPKPGGVRWLTLLDPETDRRYRRMVARTAARVEALLGPEVVANRVHVAAGTTLRLEPVSHARRRLRWETVHRSRPGDVVAFADVRDCFARIGADRVGEALLRAGCHPSEAGAVRDFLEVLGDRGIPGLPVGPPASAVLANAVLSDADARLRRVGGRHVRWVDDFVLFARDRTEAADVLAALAVALADLGLSLAPQKTRIVESGWPIGALPVLGSRVG